MLLEATRVLSAGIVRDVRDIDLGLIFGLGFPPFRGGLLRYADKIGIKTIVEEMERFEKDLKLTHFKPCAYLKKMAEEGRKFYS